MTIELFVKSFDSFGYYKERIVPNISSNQHKKHLDFSKLVYERKWDFLGVNGNFLDENNVIILIHYDEKWFWGGGLRDYANILKSLEFTSMILKNSIGSILINFWELDLLQHIFMTHLKIVVL